MEKKVNLRRDFIKKMIAYPAVLPVVGLPGTINESRNETSCFAKNKTHTNSIRVAVFGSSLGGAKTYANIITNSIDKNEALIKFDDTNCMPLSAQTKFDLYKAFLSKKTEEVQLEQFRHSILGIEKNNCDAVFSFRMPYEKNIPEIMESLSRLNFEYVFVEPQNLVETVGQWVLSLNASERGAPSSLPWTQSKVRWTHGDVHALPEMVSCFAQRYKNIKACQEYSKSKSVFQFTNKNEVKIARQFLGENYSSTYREVTFSGNALSHISNSKELTDWIQQSGIMV